MSIITLREYHLFIDSLLARNANSEAIFHCTNILSTYPKSIRTYQQLGQALLENKRFTDAAEVFSKVLSVFPDDFMAHAGLSVVHEENRELDKAIWHMEQAFETQPSNPAIQDEFRRLISRRDGTPPSKIRLTRGALIRMYAKGELYQQAIAEALSALQADIDRIDLKLLLARMYILTTADNEGAEICSEILKDSPYCFEANRIMFELSSALPDPEEYNPIFLQRLSELDPYYGFIETATENVNDVPAEKITLDQAEYYAKEEDFSRSPEWADKIGIPWHDDAGDQFTKQSLADTFIENVDDDLSVESLIPTPFIEEDNNEDKGESIIEGASSDSLEADLPEWIAKAGWIRANEDERAPDSPELAEEIPIAENLSDEVPAQPADALPDWLQSIQPEGSDSPQLFASDEEEFIPEAMIPPLPPEMLAELLSDEPDTFLDIPVSPPFGELAVQVPEKTTLGKDTYELPLTSDGEPIPDLPDWLKDLDTGEFQVQEVELNVPTPLSEEEISSKPGPASVEVPDFITDLVNSDFESELEAIAEVEIEQEISPRSIEEEIEGITSNLDLIDTKTEEVPVTQVQEEPEQKEIPVVQAKKEPETEAQGIMPAIPSWVRNILGSASDLTPVVIPVPSPLEEPELKIPASAPVTEETIEELITDLPEEPAGEGAISQEVTSELENWLQEIEVEEPDLQIAENEATVSSVEEAPEISFESLLDSGEVDELETSDSEFDTTLPSEEVTFDDRLSSMIDADGVSAPVADVAEIVEEEIAVIEKSDIEKVVNLLQSGDYYSFTAEISKLSLQNEISNQVIAELNSTLKNYPDNIELWQDLGDLQTKKANFDDALNAYREAEKNILL